MQQVATLKYEAYQISQEVTKPVQDELVVEVPLSISVGGIPLTVTMQTPGHEIELTRGLLFTEGIYKSRSEEIPIQIAERNNQGFITSLDVALDAKQQSAISKRSLLSVAACGICGKTELKWVEGKLTSSIAYDAAQITRMFIEMRGLQNAFEVSGGCHAAAVFSAYGQLLCIMEDVGRHNAVDKVVGNMLMNQNLDEARYLLVSGRVSYEIIAKTFAAGIPLLAAVSAPSSLAVDFAKELGIILLGFCRDGRVTQYA